MRVVVLAAFALASTGAGWLDPHRTAREAARLYAEGKFDEARAKYNEALVDDPDSALLHYNLGDAAYRQGKFDDARTALGGVVAAERAPSLTARAAYNTGNAVYRLAAAAEDAEPQKALELYAQALVAYRRAMGADPSDEDAKFNHELVERKMAELTKKLEEQRKKQDERQKNEQQPDQSTEQQQGDQPQEQGQPQQEHEPQEQNGPPQAKDGDPQREERQKSGQGAQEAQEGGTPEDDRQAAGTGSPGTRQDDTLAPRDAEALLDAQRDQEVRPDEIAKQLRGAGVAEPREDW